MPIFLVDADLRPAITIQDVHTWLKQWALSRLVWPQWWTFKNKGLSMSFDAFRCLSMPFAAFQCLMLPFDAFWCLTMPFDAFQCFSRPFDAFWCLTMPFDTFWGLTIPFDALRCLSMPYDAFHCLLLASSFNVFWCLLAMSFNVVRYFSNFGLEQQSTPSVLKTPTLRSH